MAKSLVSRPWEPHSAEDANKSVGDNISMRNALTENATEILKSLDLSANFWTLLRQHSVVDGGTMRRIQAKKTKTLQAQLLMLHIMEVKLYKFHGFIWALVNSDQCHLAELLGFAVRDYLDVEVYLRSSTLLCPACHVFYTKAYILTGCGHYVCAACVRDICTDNQKKEIKCPVPECGKVTEADNIGLEEDVDFSDFCQAVLKETTNESGGTTEGKSPTAREDEGGKPTAGRDKLEEMSFNRSKEEGGITTSRIDKAEELSTGREDEGGRPTSSTDESDEDSDWIRRISTSESEGEEEISIIESDEEEETTTGSEDEGGKPTAGRDEVEEMSSNGIEEKGKISTTRSDKTEEITTGREKEGGKPTDGRDEVEEVASNVIREKGEISTTGSDKTEEMTTGREKEGGKPTAGKDELEEMSLNWSKEEGMSSLGSEEEEELSTTRTDREEEISTGSEDDEDNVSLQVQYGIRKLDRTISYLQKYRVVLEKNEPEVKDYITDAAEKAKQKIDEWVQDTVGRYSSLCQQVEKKIYKSVKWQKAVSELSILRKARPSFLDGHWKAKVNLPNRTVKYSERRLINSLDAGCPIPLVLTGFPYISTPPASNPPVKAKFLLGHALKGIERCYKLDWMSDCCLMALTEKGVWKLDINYDTETCTSTLIRKTRKATDMSVAADGTRMLCLENDGVIEIKYPGLEKVKHWRPEGVDNPRSVFMNNRNIFVGEYESETIKSYSRDLAYVDEYDAGHGEDKYNVGHHGSYSNIHVTERGKLMRGSYLRGESKVHTVDLQSKKTSSFGGRDERDGNLISPLGLSTVNDDDYVLLHDLHTDLVSVFTHDGQFIHHLDVDYYGSRGPLLTAYAISVLDRRGKSSLMAIDGNAFQVRKGIGIYSLE